MHTLGRQVRFSIDPFLPEQTEGHNAFASRPTGGGISIFLELLVELVGKVNPATGFVVNVSDIDKEVRKHAVPLFVKKIKSDFHQAKHITFASTAKLLLSALQNLSDKFAEAKVNKLSLKLNPSRTITIHSGNSDMVLFSEKFEFAATHKLWNDEFSKQKNFSVFGKCANPTGHGHNYTIEVTIKLPELGENFSVSDFEKTVDQEFIEIIDHKNLNQDVEQFRSINPTVENISTYAWTKLSGKFAQSSLHCITVWESDKTFCSYYG